MGKLLAAEEGQVGLWEREGLCALGEEGEAEGPLLVQLLPPGHPPLSVLLPSPGSFLHTTLSLVPGLQPRISCVCR